MGKGFFLFFQPTPGLNVTSFSCATLYLSLFPFSPFVSGSRWRARLEESSGRNKFLFSLLSRGIGPSAFFPCLFEYVPYGCLANQVLPVAGVRLLFILDRELFCHLPDSPPTKFSPQISCTPFSIARGVYGCFPLLFLMTEKPVHPPPVRSCTSRRSRHFPLDKAEESFLSSRTKLFFLALGLP